MTESFVSELRTGTQTLTVGEPGAGAINLRVEMPEVWDTLRVTASPELSVNHLKHEALRVLFPRFGATDAFVFKLSGWDILDEESSLTAVGIKNDSILLLTHRRRRPVR